MNSNTKETKHTAPEKHVRRKHYAGRYPKNFEEKYKERKNTRILQPM